MEKSNCRPQQVTIALKLLWGSLIVGSINFVFSWDNVALFAVSYSQDTGINLEQSIKIIQILHISILIFTGLLSSWLFCKIAAGRNWARITFAILVLLGSILSITSNRELFDIAPVSSMIGMLLNVLQLTALVLLYLPASRPWFKAAISSEESKAD